MRTIFPGKITSKSGVYVVGTSDEFVNLTDEEIIKSEQKICSIFEKIVYGRHIKSIEVLHQQDDLYDAFSDKSTSLVLAASGGFTQNQLLEDLDWAFIKRNIREKAKIFCGYSDNTILCNAIFQKTKVVTFYGPNFSGFSDDMDSYTFDYFKKIITSTHNLEIFPSEKWSENIYSEKTKTTKKHSNPGWWNLGSKGIVEGDIIAGHLGSIISLFAMGYISTLKSKILFIECDSETSTKEFLSQLMTITLLPDAHKLSGLMIGRFPTMCGIDLTTLKHYLEISKLFQQIPILANLDFGHTSPKFTIPVGGTAIVSTISGQERIKFVEH
jgi:muramoyltetrapeptide carboxypeptidase